MSVSKSGGKNENKIKKLIERFGAFCIDIVESSTISECEELQAIKDYDEFHTYCTMSISVRSVCDEWENSFDSLITALYDIVQYLNPTIAENSTAVKVFFERIAGKENIFIYSYLLDGAFFKDALLTNKFSLPLIKTILDHTNSVSKNCSIERKDYEAKYLCKCGRLHSYKTYSSKSDFFYDSKEYKVVCEYCGRPSNSWKLVAARNIFLIKNTEKLVRRWIIFKKKKIEIEKIELGMQLSKFKISQ